MTSFPPSDPCYVVMDTRRCPVACLPTVLEAFNHWWRRGKLAIWRVRGAEWTCLILP